MSFSNKTAMARYTRYRKTKGYLASSFHLSVSQFKITTASLQDGGQWASHLLAFMPLYHLLPHQRLLTCVTRRILQKWLSGTFEARWQKALWLPFYSLLGHLIWRKLAAVSPGLWKQASGEVYTARNWGPRQQQPVWVCTLHWVQPADAASTDILIATSW